METINPSHEPEKNPVEDYQLMSQMKSGANWFYWIAGLSLINSLVLIFGGNWSFFAGLAVTQLVDVIILNVIKETNASFLTIVALLIDLAIAGIFVICGFFAGKMQNWAFIFGMVIYALDAVLIFLLGGYFAAGFHVFALFMIFRGLMAARKINSN